MSAEGNGNKLNEYGYYRDDHWYSHAEWILCSVWGSFSDMTQATASAQSPVLYQVCGVISQLIYGIGDAVIVFFMDKYLIMRRTGGCLIRENIIQIKFLAIHRQKIVPQHNNHIISVVMLWQNSLPNLLIPHFLCTYSDQLILAGNITTVSSKL